MNLRPSEMTKNDISEGQINREALKGNFWEWVKKQNPRLELSKKHAS